MNAPDRLAAAPTTSDSIRFLAADAVEHAASGHPGGPMGLANAVGMALAEQQLAAHFNRPGNELIDHQTYVFMGDGCLMEGISHEVGSLAGTLKLHKLIACYDDNGISIDGQVAGWFTDDTPARLAAHGWNVILAVDGHDTEAIHAAIHAA